MADGASASPAATAKLREPFKIRPELLSPERLAPHAQSLLATRTRVIEELADQGLAVVLAAAKYFIASGQSALPCVGVIGGGAVGCAALMKLLVHAYPPDRLALSTRQPERVPKCEALQSPAAIALFEQVSRFNDNTRLARESDVVLLCVPPTQLKAVALQIKFANGERSQEGRNFPLLVASALCGVSRESLVKFCDSPAVLRIQATPSTAPISVLEEENCGSKSILRCFTCAWCKGFVIDTS